MKRLQEFHAEMNSIGKPWREFIKVCLDRNLSSSSQQIRRYRQLKYFFSLIFLTYFCCCNSQISEPVSPVALTSSELLIKIEKHDAAVHIMDDWMRDPYILIGPDKQYYLTATQFDNEAKGIGFPLWRSNDLVNWVYLGVPYTLKNSSFYDEFVKAKPQDLKLWAPELYFKNNKWIVVHTTNARMANIAISDNSEVFKAPISDWGYEGFGHRHDPSLFTDDDDKQWLVSGATQIQEIKPDFSGYNGDPIVIRPSDRKIGHEGCQMLKIGTKYVLFGTAWSTDSMRRGTYNLYYCTADKVTGPYGPRKFAGRSLGHGTVFKDKKGRWWCTAFNNGTYVPPVTVAEKGIDRKIATTLNRQGLTLVPMSIVFKDGDVVVRALDPYYSEPGSEEVQKFQINMKK
jgi:arylsulfatase